MATPFISLIEPGSFNGYDPRLPLDAQPASVSKGFLDSMSVRHEVFVKEQSVPIENEFDDDDRRSCHWVVYASVNRTIEPAVHDPETGALVLPRRSETSTVPVGTIRLVPYPHDLHPLPGGVYVDGKLTAHPDGAVKPQAAPQRRSSLARPFVTDRPTDMHDGVEPYVKLGRLAVLREFRGYKLGRLLVRTALDWARKHPAYFMPSIRAMGLEYLGLEKGGSVPKWNGLVCCHAQREVVAAWEKMGFKVDHAMGTWVEEGIPHVGMFLRAEVEPEQPRPASTRPDLMTGLDLA